MNALDSTVKRARKFLRLGNSLAYEDIMIKELKGCSESEDTEYLIKAGKRDGYSFRQFGIKWKQYE